MRMAVERPEGGGGLGQRRYFHVPCPQSLSFYLLDCLPTRSTKEVY